MDKTCQHSQLLPRVTQDGRCEQCLIEQLRDRDEKIKELLSILEKPMKMWENSRLRPSDEGDKK